MVARERADTYASLVGCQQYLARIEEGLINYAKEHDGQYPESLQQLVPQHIPSLPICLKSDTPYSYELPENGYLVSCTGAHRGLAPGHPRVQATPAASATPTDVP